MARAKKAARGGGPPSSKGGRGGSSAASSSKAAALKKKKQLLDFAYPIIETLPIDFRERQVSGLVSPQSQNNVSFSLECLTDVHYAFDSLSVPTLKQLWAH